MSNIETKEQGQVSAMGKSPKDEKQNKATKPKEPDKSLDEEIALLEPEEKTVLTFFLKGLWEDDRMLSSDMVQQYLAISKADVELQKAREGNEKAKQKELKHRDGLTEQAKVDYALKELRDGNKGISCYRTELQREILEHIRDGQPLTTTRKKKEHYAYVGKGINQIFEGCSKSFRRKVINQYLNNVLPGLEAKEKEEDADQEAYDNLLAYLCKNKTTEEINTLTEQLKRAGTGKGVSV